MRIAFTIDSVGLTELAAADMRFSVINQMNNCHVP
jgi:hypothetical protein